MPLSILLSARFGLVDLPGERKQHTLPVSRGGGIALWSGMLLWALLFAPVDNPMVPYALTGGTLAFFAGYLDDMLTLPPLPRLVAHFAAAAVGLWGLHLIGVQTTLLGYVIGGLWIAGSINAYNFIDGMNGLSLGMSILSCSVMAALGFGLWAGALAALCFGAFFWNFPKAKTFMGDGGVYLLGYLIGLLQVSQTLNWLRALWAIPVLLCLGGVPTLDTLRVACRRLLQGKSPFYPDRGHLHHLLLDRGMAEPVVLASMLGLQLGFLTLAAVLFHVFH